MNYRNLILVGAFAGLGASTAAAQSTLGALLDSGATQLGKDEVTRTIVGANVSGPRQEGGTVEYNYKADGTYSGNWHDPMGSGSGGKAGGLFGKWTLGDDGKFCLNAGGTFGNRAPSCMLFYRVGDKLYVATGTSGERSIVVLERTAKR